MPDLGLLILISPFLPLVLSHIITPEILLYLQMVFQASGRIVHALVTLEYFYLLIFTADLKLSLDILGSSFFFHIILFY